MFVNYYQVRGSLARDENRIYPELDTNQDFL
jgi:hypothetical protein